ncbi:uncharacterized protein LOC105231345 [Bactrocera dorsalis]|uniref:Uncharacterized protein LOC105231345 n=1 Tax=Bactrocera dorsalis TaxID=27457 RepID=A0A6I9VDI5_BACDO|nr:uncharacterized protein LOC105231345 [Bactrocera dorsalis]
MNFFEHLYSKMENHRDESDQVIQLKEGIHKKFADLRAALQMREKLLLRQLEVVASTKQHLTECGAENNILFKSRTNEDYDIKILFEDEAELLRSIRSFGRFQLGSMVLALKQEDYITPNCDHEIMYKKIQSEENQNNLPQHKQFSQVSDSVLVDFSKDKTLIEHNVKYINDSIVNITLEEAKELIRQTQVINQAPIHPLNLEELDDDVESPIVEAVSNLSRDSYNKRSETVNMSNISDTSSVKLTKAVLNKPRVTINNCNGIINLRNISSVTINCSNENCDHLDDVKVYKNMTDISELSTPGSLDSSSNQSSNSSSRSQSKKTKKYTINAEGHIEAKKQSNQHLHNASVVPINSHSTISFEDNDCGNNGATAKGAEITCDFYSRLFNEIKRNMDQKRPPVNMGILRKTLPSHPQKGSTEQNNPNPVLLEETLQTEPQLVLKNFENLNIFLKNDKSNEPISSVHIEHWLSEIIKDTDLEPMQNNEILEHSKLK